MLKKRNIAGLLIAAALLFVPLTADALQKGEPPPDLTGTTLEGQDFLLSDYKGKPIILKVGTTWCPTCKAQTKAISNLDVYLKENDVQFIDVFLQESEKSVRKYFKRGKYVTPDAILIDNGPIYKALNVYLIPRVIFIDSDFKVYRDTEALSEKKLKQTLEEMLAGN